jgi:hypothetical protein
VGASVTEPEDSIGDGRKLQLATEGGDLDGPSSELGSLHRDLPGEDRHDEGVRLEDFYAYMPLHKYMFAPARELWPGSSVNARLPRVRLFNPDGTPVLNDDGEPVEIPATAWLDRYKPIEQMTWAPGLPMVIRGRLIFEGGWIERNNVNCFNLYRSPRWHPGDPEKADRWTDHIALIYPEDAEHIIRWFAQRVQHPAIKINHALVFGGPQGIGKDTLFEPVKRAVGPWNVAEPSPRQMIGRFNGFAKSVILRVNEARDLGEFDRYQFYEHLKSYITAPPDVLRVDEKNQREHNVLNCCGVVITTNYKANGLYLPADDRRHYVAWSRLVKENFEQGYWDELCAGTTRVVPATSPRIYRNSASPPSTQKPRRRRRPPFGTSSAPAAPPRTPRWPMFSNFSAIPRLSPCFRSS